ncbi:fimbria/pilus outer membrane usher protein [Pseudomonas sp. NPDC086251]|uniref:fimbria/pilus outer membrane usher protein n=1 Tax=Pseudomonas sp. NPDC086251 TaxID=3364431 RepID=UPI003834569F
MARINPAHFPKGLFCVAQAFSALLILPTAAHASDQAQYADVEFDQRMLWGAEADKSHVDLSRFSKGNPVSPGTYSVQLYVNDNFYQEHSVLFTAGTDGSNATACLTPLQVRTVALDMTKLEAAQRLWVMGVDAPLPPCQPISAIIPGASSRYDVSEQRLDIEIPQIFLAERPIDYIDPSLWDNGITAGRLNYALNVFSNESQGQQTTDGFLQLDAGFNYEGWRFRQLSSLSRNDDTQTYQRQRTYAETDVPSLASTLRLGETYTDGQVFDSYNFRGAMMATDERMRPASQRGYAPVVRGTANSNAKVTITQGGMTLYQRSVAPGPFEIRDLAPAGYGSDLEVTITEADGQSRTYTVPYSASAQLLRPGQFNYFTAIGQAEGPGLDNYTPKVAQFTTTYGLNNALTPYGGILASEDYHSIALGSALNTPIGAFSADFTYAKNLLDDVAANEGSSVRVLYSKLLDATQTNITLSSYRYSTEGYWSFSDMVQSENNRRDGGSVRDNSVFSVNDKQKSRFSVNLTQSLGEGWGSLYLNGETRDYWNRSGTDSLYQMTYNNSFKNINYSVEVDRTINQNGFNTTQYILSFTMPLFPSDSGNRQYLTSRNTFDDNNNGQSQATLTGTAGANGQYSYGATASQALGNSGDSSSLSMNGAYQGALANVNVGVTKGDGYTQTNAGISGGLLVHADGITLSQSLGQTVALVEAEHAAQAKILNGYGTKVGDSGFGVVPTLTPYARNRVELDPLGLSTDVQLDSTSNETIPASGAIVRVKFKTSQKTSGLITSTLSNGSPLPFGADVRDAPDGSTVGYVGQGGHIFVRGIESTGKLFIALNKTDVCVINYTLTKKAPTAKGMAAMAQATGICEPFALSTAHVQ